MAGSSDESLLSDETQMSTKVQMRESVFELFLCQQNQSTESCVNEFGLSAMLVCLHCVLVPILLLVYCWTLFVIVYWRVRFTNPFYWLAVGLGLCNVLSLLWFCYLFANSYLQRSPFNDDKTDLVMAAASWVLWFSNIFFQIVIGSNRALAIVWYDSYLRLFTAKATLICIFACFAISAIMFAPVFGNHPVKFDISSQSDRFMDEDDQFSYAWDWLEKFLSALTNMFILFCYAVTFCFVHPRRRAVANRTALGNEVRLMLASFVVVCVLLAFELVYFLELDFVYNRTLECLYHGLPPLIYLTFDSKLRRHMLWCQCLRAKLYFNQNGAFETLTVSGRAISGKVKKRYKRMPVENNSVSDDGEKRRHAASRL